ncbi:MAG: D-tyrosyl-tRNA(Tyr) deacylase [Lachnospiraceae bacterium]|nr:D-tyrosyl-tRNA(Tyr) deacylase [Lachnospiraceae bacterium]
MKFLTQNVLQASVSIDDEIVGAIDQGLLVLIGVSDTDTYATADKMIQKLLNLRIFEDENGKTNINIFDAKGELLLVSQFTLYADCKHGNRPSFIRAGKPDHAVDLYEYIIKKCKESGLNVATGKFGAYMQVSLVNNGPFTVILDSEELGY